MTRCEVCYEKRGVLAAKREARRAGASEREDDDGEERKLPRTVGAGAPLCWTLGAGLSGSAGPCTDSTYGYVLLVVYFSVHVKNPQQLPPLRAITEVGLYARMMCR